MADKIQLRRDNSEVWQLVNPVLSDGEIGYERDFQRIKIGNGVDAWNDLPYADFTNVRSVNGQIGEIVLDAGDVGAIAIGEKGIANGVAGLNAEGKVVDADGNEVEGKVTSVNGRVGDVNIQEFSGDYSDLSGIPTTFTPTEHEHAINEVTGLQDALGDKVDKIDGKQLTTNDFTNTEKNKLEGIESGAQVNEVTSVNGQKGNVQIETFSGNYDELTNKPTIPTKTSQLENDSNFVTRDYVDENAGGGSIENNAGAHNAIYRGKNLGNSYTPEQQAVVEAGTFDDLFIGDYWEIDGVIWRIAAFDYFLSAGNAETTQHHVTIVPDRQLYTQRMNSSNTTDTGYIDSEMRLSGLDQARTQINAAFNNRILSYRDYLTNAATNGEASGVAWVDADVELMNEHMLYGGFARTETINYREVGISKSQLPLFQHRHDLITNRQNYWLRNVSTAATFVVATSSGRAHAHAASYALGVRPAFSVI